MTSARRFQSAFALMPWGLILIWWGTLQLIPATPSGVGPLGFAVILLGVNVLRIATGGRANHLSVGLGVGLLILSALLFVRGALHAPLDLAILPIMLMACGAMLIGWELLQGYAHENDV